MNKKNIIEFVLDDKKVLAQKNESIWQVANRLGKTIPHLCHSGEPGYRSDGNCRACMVEIEGEGVLAASCIRKPTKGMKVSTSSHTAKSARKTVFELLASDQPPREQHPDPDSSFWSWSDNLKIMETKFPRLRKTIIDDSHSAMHAVSYTHLTLPTTPYV